MGDACRRGIDPVPGRVFFAAIFEERRVAVTREDNRRRITWTGTSAVGQIALGLTSRRRSANERAADRRRQPAAPLHTRRPPRISVVNEVNRITDPRDPRTKPGTASFRVFVESGRGETRKRIVNANRSIAAETRLRDQPVQDAKRARHRSPKFVSSPILRAESTAARKSDTPVLDHVEMPCVPGERSLPTADRV